MLFFWHFRNAKTAARHDGSREHIVQHTLAEAALTAIPMSLPVMVWSPIYEHERVGTGGGPVGPFVRPFTRIAVAPFVDVESGPCVLFFWHCLFW